MASLHLENLGPRNLLNFCTRHGMFWDFLKFHINLFRSAEGTGMVSEMMHEILMVLGLDLNVVQVYIHLCLLV